MEPNKILSARLEDLIFDGRNKAYGAYALRKTYPGRIIKSLISTIVISGILFASLLFSRNAKKVLPRPVSDSGFIIKEVTFNERPKEIPKPKMPSPPSDPVRTVAAGTPKIVAEDEVKRLYPTVDQFDSARAGTVTNMKGSTHIFVPPPSDYPGGGTTPEAKDPEPEPEQPLVTVDVAASFNGNWKRFLETNLDAEVPVDNGAPAGRYSVVVQFVVDKDGSVSDIKPLTNHGYGVEQEAVRVLRKAPKWTPAIFNNHTVKAFHRQVIVFEVTE